MANITLKVPDGTALSVVYGDGATYAVTDGLVTVPTSMLIPLLRGGFTIADPSVQGVQFPSANVPSTDANCLDAYAEASFTPALKLGGAAVDMAYGTQVGRSTRVGRLVTFNLHLTLTALGSSTGAATITGMPVAAVADAEYAFHGLLAGTGPIVATLSGTTLTLLKSTGAALANTDLANTSDLRLSGSYVALA